MQTEKRQLKDLTSVGPAMLADFALLGIESVTQLKRRSPQRMYDQLCRLQGQRLDPCCLDVFVAAVAQARDPELPVEQRQWWYWSKVRKRKNVPASAL
jgi:Pathogenicity locus